LQWYVITFTVVNIDGKVEENVCELRVSRVYAQRLTTTKF